MPANFNTYKQNQAAINEELGYLNNLLLGAFRSGALEGLSKDRQRELDKLHAAIDAVQDDIRKTKEAEAEKQADEKDQAQNRVNLFFAPPKTYYKTDEQLLQQHLNQLGKLPTILNYKIGEKSIKDILAPTPRERRQLDGSLRVLGEGLDMKIAPEGPGLYYDEYLLHKDSALQNIDALKAKIASPEFKELNDIEKQETVAAVFASRMAVNSVMGDKSSLKKEMDPKVFKKNFQALLKSDNFRRFVNTTSSAKIADAMSGGHGGALETMYREFNTRQTEIPSDLSRRHAPLAADRIEHLQKALKTKDLLEAAKRDLIFDIMATRIAAGAVRGSKDSLKTPVSAAKLEAARTRLALNKTFNEMLKDPKHLEAMSKSLTGRRTHGGGVEDYVRKFTAQQEGYRPGNPEWLNPKMPPLPKSFKEAQDALNAVTARKPANPALVDWHLAAAVYMANAEQNPRLNQNPTQNMFERVEQLQANENYRYMLQRNSVAEMTNKVNKGPNQVNFEFGKSQQLLQFEKNLAEIKKEKEEQLEGLEGKKNGPQIGGIHN